MHPSQLGPRLSNPLHFTSTTLEEVQPLYYYDIQHMLYILPECFLFICTLLLLFYGSYKFRNKKDHEYVIASGKGLILIFTLTILLLMDSFRKQFKGIVFYDLLEIENFTTVAKIIVLILTISLLFSAKKYSSLNELKEYDHLVILGFITGGLCVILSSNDFITLILAIELVSYGLYTLANLKKESIFGVEASTKYYVTGILATGLYAYGASHVYLQTKTLNFFTLHGYMYEEKVQNIFGGRYNFITQKFDLLGSDYILLIFGISLMLILLLFKIAAAPFHVWSPDVYEGVPMIITAYYSIVIKFVMLTTFFKVVRFVLGDFIYVLRPGLIFVVVLSLLLGSIGAAHQDKIKRVFAYSSISHVGYILMGLIPFTDTGFTASLIYIFVYTLTNLVLFNFLLLTHRLSFNGEGAYVALIGDLAKIGNTNPLLGFFFSCTLFSFAGIPPFAGFFAKLGVFYSLMERGYGLVVLVALVSTAISCFYYLKMIKATFFVKTANIYELVGYDKIKEMTIFWGIVPIMFYVFFADKAMEFTQHLINSYFMLFAKW